MSAIELQPDAAGTYLPTDVTSGVFVLAPKDSIRITYSAAPTINRWGV
ncbi:hypothetical protein ACFFWD_22730 [Bradyrhizobium erythrophlei]